MIVKRPSACNKLVKQTVTSIYSYSYFAWLSSIYLTLSFQRYFFMNVLQYKLLDYRYFAISKLNYPGTREADIFTCINIIIVCDSGTNIVTLYRSLCIHYQQICQKGMYSLVNYIVVIYYTSVGIKSAPPLKSFSFVLIFNFIS